MHKLINSIKAGIGNSVLYLYDKLLIRPKKIYENKKRKNCRFNEPVIFVGNHTSHLDGIMTSVEFRKNKAHIVVAKDWYEKKSINWYLKNAKCIPMDRFKLDTEWLREARQALGNGESIILYPEGKTSKTGEIGEFKSGFIMLAVMMNVPVVPFAIDGDYKMGFGQRQRILIGEPVELSSQGKSLNIQYMEKESERFRQMVINMKEKIRR